MFGLCLRASKAYSEIKVETLIWFQLYGLNSLGFGRLFAAFLGLEVFENLGRT